MDIEQTFPAGENNTEESEKKTKGDVIERIIRKRSFSYIFMIFLMVYLLLSGYILYFSGSLFIEALYKGWWRPDATEFDNTSLFLGYLFGFPSLLGVIGGIVVLTTHAQKLFRFKVLFFVPSIVWSSLLVLDIIRRPLEEWYHWFYLVPALLICVFVLFNVVKKVKLPYFK
ncbi:hypothetical protein ACFL60_02130 [Candidatus Omnitrophota bacterium]